MIYAALVERSAGNDYSLFRTPLEYRHRRRFFRIVLGCSLLRSWLLIHDYRDRVGHIYGIEIGSARVAVVTAASMRSGRCDRLSVELVRESHAGAAHRGRNQCTRRRARGI